jgi:hypothetical protein
MGASGIVDLEQPGFNLFCSNSTAQTIGGKKNLDEKAAISFTASRR